MIATKLSRRQRVRMAQRIQALRARWAFRLAAALRGFFQGQARRVAGRYRTGATAAELLPPSEDDRLERLYTVIMRGALEDAAELADAQLAPGRKVLDPGLESLLRGSGVLIVEINEATRAALADLLVEAAEEGLNLFQTVNGSDTFPGLRGTVEETYRNRARAIARTEMAKAQQRAAHLRYAAAGVREVDIIDGPGCGWTSHDDPDKANGSRRTVAEADAFPTAHPNCTRVSLPVVVNAAGQEIR